MYPPCSRALGALALLAAIPSSAALAAEADTATVIVTATRQPQRANELLADVSTITREEIEAAGQTSLPELLAREPGITYSANGAPGSASSLFIRGTNSNHTVILVDGTRVGSATLGTTALERIPLAHIERIEILRGPASALYGADALGGVIQIFTRQGSGPARVNAEVAYGSDNTKKLSAGVSGQQESWKYSFQASRDETDGFSSIRNKKNANWNPDDDGFRNTAFSGSLAYRFNKDHEVGLNAFSSDGRNDYDSSWPRPASSDYRSEHRVTGYSLYSRNRLLPDWQSTVRLGRGIDDNREYADGIKNSTMKTEQDQFSWQNDIKLSLGKALLAAEWLRQDISSTSQYDRSERTIKSLLAGWGANAGNHRWQINLRHDDISQTGSKNTRALSYGYQINEVWRTHAAYGTAFKAPSMNDLYWPGTGNPHLKPEYARNREVALHYETAQHTASLTYFRNNIEDLIQWRPQSPGSWAWVPQNVDSAKITGWSLAWKGRFGPFALRSSLDLTDPRDKETDKRLVRRARRQASVGVDYTANAWTLGGEVIASGPRFDDMQNTARMGGYALTNLTASYRLDKDVSLFARINNVFDKQYELVRYYGTSGLNALVGLRYQPK